MLGYFLRTILVLIVGHEKMRDTMAAVQKEQPSL